MSASTAMPSAPSTSAPGPAAPNAASLSSAAVAPSTAAAPAAPTPIESSASSSTSAPGATPLPKARAVSGDQYIARLLRYGAASAGLCFLTSLLVELLPESPTQAYLVDLLRKGGMMLLIATPIARLIAAGIMLGTRGEWRYALFTGCILLLLAFAIGAGFSA